VGPFESQPTRVPPCWVEALSARTEPEVESVGFGYMLQGGSTPSNTDPFANAPADGEPWLEEPPHVMMVVPDPAALEALPTDPDNGGPWIMWQGTPYAHVMMPVQADGVGTARGSPGTLGGAGAIGRRGRGWQPLPRAF